MVLSDRTIKEEIASGRLIIDPLHPDDIQPASVDVHIDRVFRVFKVSSRPYIDVREPMDDLTEEVVIDTERPFFIHPGEFVLASTLEVLTLPDDILAQVEGKSSLGRIGLLIHATAGFVDPGWTGKLTLELSNVAKMPIALHYGMKIGQLSFLRMSTPVDRPYGSPELHSKYQGQMGPTPSRAHREFEDRGP
ncbi:MAG TPA: dCTP deaminase [Dehalococcoidia bacterium]|nr:dCTP deaminase [Dehalococcoidia bacterium]